jgi:hypothetical protein
MDHVLAEAAQGVVHSAQAGTKEECKIIPLGGTVGAEVQPNQSRQGLREVPFRQIRQQAARPTMVDVGSFLPAGVARAAEQPAVTPDQVV